MSLVDFGKDDRGIEAVLTLLEVLHDRHDRLGPLPPHECRRFLARFKIVVAIREVISPL